MLLALGRYFDTNEAVTPEFTARLWLGEDSAGEQAFHGRTIATVSITVRALAPG